MALKIASVAMGCLLAGCAAAQSAVPPTPAVDVREASSSSAFTSCRQAAPKAADPNGTHGLMVWIYSTQETTKNPAIMRYVAKDKRLCGASIVFLWSGIDAGPAALRQYHYAVVENAIAPWIAAGKSVNLLFTGVDEVGPTDHATPAWVLAQTGSNAVTLVPCPNPGGGSVGPPTPVYWQQGYSVPWRNFIAAMIGHFGKRPNIGYMRFGIGAGAEDFPQHGADGNCFAAWQSNGLTGAKFWADFSASLTRYIGNTAKTAGATVQMMVALNPFSDPAAPYPVADRVAEAAANYNVGFGTENLGSGSYGSTTVACSQNTSVPYWCDAYDTYTGKVPLEFQPINFTLQPGAHVAPLPELLPYAIYNHAQIFELYAQEWLTADDPQYQYYAANHVAWNKVLNASARILGGSP